MGSELKLTLALVDHRRGAAGKPSGLFGRVVTEGVSDAAGRAEAAQAWAPAASARPVPAVLGDLLAVAVRSFLASGYQMFQLTMLVVYAIAMLGLNLRDRLQRPDLARPRRVLRRRRLCHGDPDGAISACPTGRRCRSRRVVCSVAGFLFGFPRSGSGGLYLALATFALAVATPQILKYKGIEDWTGGVQGLVIPSRTRRSAFRSTPTSGCTCSASRSPRALSWSARNLVRGRIGRALIAIRDQPIAAEAMGIDARAFKTRAFAVSAHATPASPAGLSAIAVQFVAPDSFTVFLSLALFVGIVVGGVASLAGALFGARVHRVRAQHRRADLEGGARRDLRRRS